MVYMNSLKIISSSDVSERKATVCQRCDIIRLNQLEVIGGPGKINQLGIRHDCPIWLNDRITNCVKRGI
ncbi:hypothetical protein ATO9_17560 [Pseudooceanicola atlanticus]|uniref:Uncharacterized protein n=1 Tax=Pseudooceanicola atlanticus TaxID=1461694 RepID=A0A0A0EBL0_9RHOB|nr:hypothetical protein ATO9_17560 [Pseudooceanicola atlanticus]